MHSHRLRIALSNKGVPQLVHTCSVFLYFSVSRFSNLMWSSSHCRENVASHQWDVSQKAHAPVPGHAQTSPHIPRLQSRVSTPVGNDRESHVFPLQEG